MKGITFKSFTSKFRPQEAQSGCGRDSGRELWLITHNKMVKARYEKNKCYKN